MSLMNPTGQKEKSCHKKRQITSFFPSPIHASPIHASTQNPPQKVKRRTTLNSEKSASHSEFSLGHNFDYQIESQFLSQYLMDLITQTMSDKINYSIYQQLLCEELPNQKHQKLLKKFEIEQEYIKNQINLTESIFFAKDDLLISEIINGVRQKLQEVDGKDEQKESTDWTNSRSLSDQRMIGNSVIEVYSNEYLTQYNRNKIRRNELIYIESRLSITNDNLKTLLEEIEIKINSAFSTDNNISEYSQQTKKSFNYISGNTKLNFIQTFVEYYRHSSIVILLFVNCDINFEFDHYFNHKEIYINGQKFFLKLKIVYISKQLLKDHFQLNYKSDSYYIGERSIAQYKLKKIRLNKQIIIQNGVAVIQKQKMMSNKKKIIRQLSVALIGTSLLFLGWIFFMKKKILPLAQVGEKRVIALQFSPRWF